MFWVVPSEHVIAHEYFSPTNMQTTELDPALSQTLGNAEKSGLKLVIANKNYSSWSMRPWVVMTAFNIPFQEISLLLDRSDTSARIAHYSSAGRVPILLAGETTIWDSLAICEYLAEQFPEKKMWPEDVAARALARSICAEMHSGFTGVRSAMWMNIRASFPGKGRTIEND
jgi:glutathione S-transferase